MAAGAGQSVAQPATKLLILTLVTVNWESLQCWTRLRFMEMTSQHRQYHQILQRCEDWLKDPFADEDAEDFDFEGFLEEVANYVESNMSSDADKVLQTRVVTVTTLYNVQLAEMDLAHAAKDFSDAVEVSLRCSEAHESPLLLLLRAYSTLKLASLGNFDFYAEGFRAIARALPKLEERSWRRAYHVPIANGKNLFQPWEVFLFFMKSDWPIHGLLSWRRSTAVASFKELELAGHPGATLFLDVLRQPCRGMMARPAPTDLGAVEWQEVVQQLELEGAEDPRGNLREVLAATTGSGLDYVPEPVEKWHATERWEIDRPQGEIAMSLVNFNNRLVRLLDQIRTENALPGADRPVPCSLLQDVWAKLGTAAGFQTAFVHGSSSRGTSVDDMGGLDWGQDCASDIDFVLLFTTPDPADPSPDAFKELWKTTEEQLAGWDMDPGVPVTLSRGRFGLVASLSEDLQIEVDLIPAISDPQGGHWILDSLSGKVIHNNPKALAEFMDRKVATCFGWADLVVLCKFWNKRLRIAVNGRMKSPFTSLHVEVALTTLEAPLPPRLDAAFHLALRALHAQRDASPAPWTGRPVAEYLTEDAKRRHGAVEQLEKAIGVVEDVLRKPRSAPQTEALVELFQLTDEEVSKFF